MLDDLNSIVIASYQDCKKCPRLVEVRRNIVWGKGRLGAPIMAVGLGPGEAEDESGSPFVGPSGEQLWVILEEIGITREMVHATNAVLCRPARPIKGTQKFLENVDPTLDEINNCRPRLHYEIEKVDPLIIIALGSVAMRSLSGKDIKVSGVIGKTFDIQVKTSSGNSIPYPVIPMFHPSFILRGISDADNEQMWRSVNFLKKVVDFFLK